MIVFALACVLDRTGQSATGAMERELADHNRRVRELESVGEDVGRRLGQLEEVQHARGQEEILKMETMEQLRQEVAAMRGELDVLHHDYSTFEEAGLGFQTDADSRINYLETRIGAVEKSLGLRPPPPPGTVDSGGNSTGSTAVVTNTPPPEVPETPASTPDEYFALIAAQLEEGNAAAARAIAQRFIKENPKHERVVEAYYRIAESWQNAGEFKPAVAAFQDVIDKGKDSTWAPWAMLRQGECFDALGSPDKAKVFYCDVSKVYPKSKAAKEGKLKCGK